MLVMALAATLVGFGLLVVALVTGTLWLAIACIVVCIIGGVFLLADLLGLGNALTARRSRAATPPAAETSDARDPDAGEPDAETSGAGVPDSEVSAPEVFDSEVTTEFPRIPADEPVVSLDDPESAEPVKHGRHESDDAAHGPTRPPRHGSPDR